MAPWTAAVDTLIALAGVSAATAVQQCPQHREFAYQKYDQKCFGTTVLGSVKYWEKCPAASYWTGLFWRCLFWCSKCKLVPCAACCNPSSVCLGTCIARDQQGRASECMCASIFTSRQRQGVQKYMPRCLSLVPAVDPPDLRFGMCWDGFRVCGLSGFVHEGLYGADHEKMRVELLDVMAGMM